jgi:hypothetical protein
MNNTILIRNKTVQHKSVCLLFSNGGVIIQWAYTDPTTIIYFFKDYL